jgi:hypothetical protein
MDSYSSCIHYAWLDHSNIARRAVEQFPTRDKGAGGSKSVRLNDIHT